MWGHTGNTLGYTQFMAASPDGSRSVVVSVNEQLTPIEGAPGAFEALRRASYPAVELALATQVREVLAQVMVGQAPEVALASEAGPLGEDGEREDLRFAEPSVRDSEVLEDGARATSRPRARTMRPRRSRDPCRGTAFGRRFGTSISSRLLLCGPQLLISRLRSS